MYMSEFRTVAPILTELRVLAVKLERTGIRWMPLRTAVNGDTQSGRTELYDEDYAASPS